MFLSIALRSSIKEKGGVWVKNGVENIQDISITKAKYIEKSPVKPQKSR